MATFIGKSYYAYESRKRVTRQGLIGRTDKKRVITLLGSSPENAIPTLLQMGFEKILSLELVDEVFQKQKAFANKNIIVTKGDIRDIFIDDEFFYDADLCGIIFKFGDFIYKIRHMDSLLTFSVRDGQGRKLKDMLDFFMRSSDNSQYEAIKGMDGSILLNGDKHIFRALTYRDGMPMLSIRKLLNKAA